MPAKRNWVGLRFGLLIVLAEMQNRRASVVCDCGQLSVVARSNLSTGHTVSCGCWQGKKHGNSYMPEYRVWCAMIYRCNNPKARSYKDYGGRGIKICDRWLKFENFLADMGELPLGLSIDRKDNNGNYEPGNCRWATAQQQQLNKRHKIDNRWLEWVRLCQMAGLSLRKIAPIFGCSGETVRQALINHQRSFEKC